MVADKVCLRGANNVLVTLCRLGVAAHAQTRGVEVSIDVNERKKIGISHILVNYVPH